MSYTEADLLAHIATLEGALIRGEKEVEFQDRRVVYSSAAEIRERIDYFRGLLPSTDTAVPRRSRQTRMVASNGF